MNSNGDELRPEYPAGLIKSGARGKCARLESKLGDRHILDTLRRKRESINAAGRQFGARRIRVFCSVARGEEGPDSDIDFLVDFPRGYDLFAQRLPLLERLAEITGRRPDLVPEHELNRHIRTAVLEEAVDL